MAAEMVAATAELMATGGEQEAGRLERGPVAGERDVVRCESGVRCAEKAVVGRERDAVHGERGIRRPRSASGVRMRE